MPEQRRRFSPQFKAEAVQMVLETGKPIAEVERHGGTVAPQRPIRVRNPRPPTRQVSSGSRGRWL